MGKISQNTINQIFQRADVLDVVSSFSEIDLKKAGNVYKARSPFQEEKTPSFYVVPHKGIWKDFSSGKGGNAVSFLMEYQKKTYPEALRWLADKYHIEIEEEDVTEEEAGKVTLYEVMKKAHNQFKKCFKDLPEEHPAKLYIKERFSDDQIIKWGIGYAPPGWDFLKKLVIDHGVLDQAISCGLVVKKNEKKVYDFFRDRIMIPIINESGDVISFGGRVYKGRGEALDDAKYMNGGQTPIFDKSSTLFGLQDAIRGIHDQGEAWICEGYTDVMALHDQGLTHVVGSMGTALTELQVRKLSRYTKTICLMFDGDSAGIKAIRRSIPEILKQGLRCFVISLDEGKDPEEFITEFLNPSDQQEEVMEGGAV